MIFTRNAPPAGGYRPHIQGLCKLEASRSGMIFANVAIDTTTRELGDRLFTYEVPPHLRGEVFVGSLVLVPLGANTVPAYIVGLEDASGKAAKAEFKIRPIIEVLESDPLFDRDYIEFLHYIADYYGASIVEVIAAAIPADLGPRVKRVARLMRPQQGQPLDPTGLVHILNAAKNNSLAVKALRQRSGLPQNKFYAALARLRQEGIVAVERESDSKVAPKVVQKVILNGSEGATKKQSDILAVLKRAGGEMPVSALADAADTTNATIKRMCATGILNLVEDEVMRDPLSHLNGPLSGKQVPPELTDHQRQVYGTLHAELTAQLATQSNAQEPSPAQIPWLLHGVTGSGKTEIYLRLIHDTLEQHRSALMLVPEISLTPQLAQRLVSRFGDLVAVWHSGLSPGERFDTWRRLRAGQARVLLGARSAALANLPDLGLIILDEEHDSSYKQSSPSPRYHAKDLAVERARRCGALVLLGSATPDVATFEQCRLAGKIVELPERVHKQALPHSTMVDMRQEYALGNRSIFSRHLQDALGECLKKKEQAILLINRRGYASHVFCRACGHVTKCRHCSVSLVYHQIQNRNLTNQNRQYGSPFARKQDEDENDPNGYLMCHHCGFRTSSWITCPACHSPFVRQLGLGTQRVEEEAKELFPSARMLRLDSDITSRRGAYEEVFNQFTKGEADILIGTQIVAKGLDIERVTLVGVLAADSAFNLPDYRSVERGFQLLTQVSGRAGRGHHLGRVVLQTFNIDLPALELARNQDYQSFVRQELESRKVFEYPPYSQIIRVVISGEHEQEVQFACEQLAEELSSHLDDAFTEDQIKIIGPAPCLIERIRSKYRHHLIIKNMAGGAGRKAVTQFLKLRRSTATLTLAVDIDAVDLV
jgi:primosomal protein N' (replication factor Y) (superfamily II helicase)